MANASSVPGWVWLFTGAVLGAFIMFLAYLSGLAPEARQHQQQTTAPAPAAKPDAPQAGTEDKPKFDFYTLLRESEVLVPDEPEPAPGSAAAAPAEDLRYLLQAGSFKRAEDADRRRAEVILLNLDANIETVEVRPGEIWHRVIVGPIDSRSKLAQARQTLIGNGIDTLVIKRKAEE